MRHDRGAEDAHRKVEHLRITHDLHRRRKAEDDLTPVGIGHRHLHAKAYGDYQERADDERLDPAEAQVLQIENEKNVERRDEHADLEWNAEQQIEADGRADHLGEIGGADGYLRHHPQYVADGSRKAVSTCLGKIAARGEAEARAQRLQQDRHEVRHQRDAQQRVAELGATGERRGPVAGVHVADGDEVPRSQEREHTAPPYAVYRYGAPHLPQRRLAPRTPPAVPTGCVRGYTRSPHRVLHRRFLAGVCRQTSRSCCE